MDKQATAAPQVATSNRVKRPLLFKFSILIIASIVIVVLVLTFTTIEREERLLTVSTKERGVTLVKTVALSCGNALVAADVSFMVDNINEVSKEKGIVYALVVSGNNECKVASDPSLEGKSLEDPVSLKAIQATTESPVIQRYYNSDLKEDMYDISFPIVISKEGNVSPTSAPGFISLPVGALWGFVRLGISLRELKFMIRQTYIQSIFMAIGVILLGFLVSFYLARNIVKPINKLMEGAIAISKGNLKYQISVHTEDEIGGLARAFNKMTNDLRESRDEIEEYSRTLEDKIEARTKELKEAQVKLIQSAKMAAIGQLGAGAAHELNNPIGGILGYAQFLLQKLEKPAFDAKDFEKFKDYVGYIKRESERCKAIVENLLTFSRKPSEAFEPINIKEVLENFLLLVRNQLEIKNIKLSTEYASGLPLVSGNANQLQQVFTNIVINAQQAMPDGGSLRIRTSLGDNGSKVQIEFSDTGCGMPPENLEHIFEAFFTTKKDWKSVGLGLSISYQIIKEHKGDIQVESKVGKGATFRVILPKAT